MAVKHTHPDSRKTEVHKGKKGGTTGCGVNTNKNPEHWTDTSDKITCAKNGCSG